MRDAKVAAGSADMTAGPALTEAELDAALGAGARRSRASSPTRGVDCLVLGEIGIGNTATAAALVCALTGASAELTVGRGTGLDAAGLERKRATVAARARAARRAAGCARGAAPRRRPRARRARRRRRAAAALRLPVLLDGYAVAAAALAAVGLDPLAGEVLIAGHRSAEPGHDLVLAELGLEPLLDLRLRLGEASGALLALPLIEAAGALHRRMGTFEESGVARAR